MPFRDRAHAGRRLAEALREPLRLLGSLPGALVVEGMARGGVPVAFAVADILDAPLDVLVVRKLGHPRQPELGLGAIAEGGVRLVNTALVTQLGVPEQVIDQVATREEVELRRRLRTYRGDRPAIAVADRTAVVVDDGLATGFTARAAVEVMRRRGAAQVVLGVPVGPPAAVAALAQVADDVVCVETSEGFVGISERYDDFRQVSDEEVARLLQASGSWDAGSSDGGS